MRQRSSEKALAEAQLEDKNTEKRSYIHLNTNNKEKDNPKPRKTPAVRRPEKSSNEKALADPRENTYQFCQKFLQPIYNEDQSRKTSSTCVYVNKRQMAAVYHLLFLKYTQKKS